MSSGQGTGVEQGMYAPPAGMQAPPPHGAPDRGTIWIDVNVALRYLNTLPGVLGHELVHGVQDVPPTAATYNAVMARNEYNAWTNTFQINTQLRSAFPNSIYGSLPLKPTGFSIDTIKKWYGIP